MGGHLVWIVGGGIMQVPAILEAKKRGYKVIVSDINKECIGRQYTDDFYPIDTYDIKGHLNLADITPVVIGVLAPGADVGPTVSALAEFFGTPSCSLESALDTRNKAAMRLLVDDKYPRFDIVQSPSESAAHFWEIRVGYPCVIKPVDNCATRGISVAHNRAEFIEGIKVAMKANKQSTGVVIEELLCGPEWATDFFIVNRQAILVNAVKRYFRHHIPGEKTPLFGIEGAIINPWYKSSEEDGITGIFEAMATRAASKLGVTEGPFKLDIIYDERYGFCILEAATRLSGGFDHAFMSPMVGKDITGLLLDYATGVPFDYDKLKWNGKYAASYMPYHRSGKICGWEVNELDLHDKYEMCHYFTRSDTEIQDLRNCAARSLWVLCKGDTPQRALLNAMKASKEIKPRYD